MNQLLLLVRVRPFGRSDARIKKVIAEIDRQATEMDAGAKARDEAHAATMAAKRKREELGRGQGNGSANRI